MGRSKFPGKPSKHVNRKRINVLPATSDTIIECSQSLTVETIVENKQELSECVENDDESLNNTVNISKVSLRKRLNRKLQNSKNVLNTSSSKRNLISKICNKTNNRTINNKPNRQTNLNRKSLHGYSMKTINKQRKNKNTVPKETNNSIVGKFVLPTRSVHSSRVIKPNKRFINVDLNDTLSFKKKTVNNKKTCGKGDGDYKQPSSDNKINSISDKTSSSSSSSSITTTITNSIITTKNTVNPVTVTPSTSSSTSNFSNTTTNTTTTSPTKPLPNGRIVLRQARLKLHTQTTISNSDGPFSSNITNNSPPGTVTCGVCGAVRFYRFVKQARKFNIYSCESCRKFISKMIKRQNCGKNTSSNILVCHEGQGMCHVPPVVRNQQMKVVRCGYKARCPACWLKMCLRSFQMPLSLKHSLAQLLPKYMQGSDVMFSNSLPLLWQMSNKNLNNPITNDNKNNYNDNIKQRPVRLKNNTSSSSTTTKSTTSQSLQISNDIKRQKIDLKGPRVKHVCRSASIVLGQPQATFPIEIDKNKIDNKEQIDNKRQKIETKSNNSSEDIKTSIKINKIEQVSSENDLSDSDKNSAKLQDIINDNVISFKRDKLKYIDNKIQTEKKQIRPEIQSNMVCFDYYENFELDDINHDGFCLISSQQFPVNGVCFLCGSGGRETLLYCSLCCEPYHPYCLEQLPLINNINNNNNNRQLWLCPKCTKCTLCNQSDRQKMNCQMCSKTYHPECLDAKRNGSNHRPNVCFECLTCKNCKNQITNLNGNLPFCSACLKIRKESNICTLCLNIFKEDVDELIMECTNCHKWVHVKCEGLSEEYYQILTLLPEKLRYICRLCSKEITPYWRKLVDAELNFNFNQVIRLLIKNKIARNLLKLNPINKQKKTKKLQCDDNNDIDSIDEIDDIEDGIANLENNINNDNNNKNSQIQCNYDVENINNILTVQNIRNKLNSNQYSSLKEFDGDMEEVLNKINSIDLIKIYRSILSSIFPWYNRQSKSLLDGKFPIQKQHILTDTIITFDNNCTQIDNNIMDTRYCQLCRNLGDGYSESRLLYCGQNEWVHANCALWSDEVYEEIDGSLQNVYDAINRGRITNCTYCKQKGATLSCCYKNCMEIYHFICAKNSNCTFMNDKKIYCLYHLQLFKTNNQITNFQLSRTIFVELTNNDKEKYYPIDKVNVMIGSLRVISLGKINPLVSDNVDVLIPTGYVCTRLYWSTVEPWKLVNYKITTSVINCNTNNSHIERNFTVDHTLSRSVVERKLKEIYVWQKDIDKKRTDIINDFDDDDEPQNGAADLLSPEITDAIFEELPHELLDGISVQDIFPKLMTNYEDFVTNDTGNKLIDNSNNDITDNTENFNDFNNDNKNQQRSCSLTLSCKLDNTFSPAIKKRKIAPPRENNLFFQLLQVDGAFDDSGSSDCESPTDNIDDTILTTTPTVTNIWNNNHNIEEPVTCERCHCTYRTKASYKRHLDSCELICSSESDSELNQEQDNCINIDTTLQNSHLNITEKCSTVVINETTQQPVVLASSFESYQNEIHTAVLNTHQTFVSSKSAELITTVPQCNNNITNNNTNSITTASNSNSNVFVSPITQTSVDSNHHHQQQNDGFTTINRCPTLSVNESAVPIQNNQFCLNQTTVPICVNPTSLSLQTNSTVSVNSPIINQNNQILNQAQLEYQPSVTIQPVCYSNNLQPIINVTPQNQINFANNKLITSNSFLKQGININNTTINMSQSNRWTKPVGKPAVFTKSQQKIKNPKGRTIIAKRQIDDNDNTIIIPSTASLTLTSTPSSVSSISSSAQSPSSSSSTSQPTVIVQHLPSTTNFIPTFVDTFPHHQNNQNLQYLTTITTPQLNSQPLVQLQTDNNIISLLPGMQPTTMIIQQQPTRILENQLVLDSNGSLTWAPQQITQPIYYGFETIVQNTIMQSQQFLPTTVPGVLTANSSYSTTTQVFQTSKLEPVIADVSTNNFVLLNPGQLMNQSIQVSQNTTQHYQQPQINNNNNNLNSVIQNKNTITTTATMAPTIPTTIITTSTTTATTTTTTRLTSCPVKYSSANNNNINNSIINNNNIILQKSEKQTTQSYTNSNNNNNNTNITLPTSPFISELGIPTNIVTPTPKLHHIVNNNNNNNSNNNNNNNSNNNNNNISNSNTNQNRPMSRVLPMQNIKETNSINIGSKNNANNNNNSNNYNNNINNNIINNNNHHQIDDDNNNGDISKNINNDKTDLANNLIKDIKTVEIEIRTIDKIDDNEEKIILNDDKQMIIDNDNNAKSEPIKMIFHKQTEDGTYKISNLFDKTNTIDDGKLDNFVTKLNDNSSCTPITTITTTTATVTNNSSSSNNNNNNINNVSCNSPENTFKLSNFTKNSPVAPLKPIKSNYTSPILPLGDKLQNSSSVDNIIDKKIDILSKKQQKQPQLQQQQQQDKKDENSPTILYTIETQDGFKYSSTSVADMWTKLFETVQNARIANNMPPLPSYYNNNVHNNIKLLGLKSPSLKYLIEQLPGVNKCTKYKPTYNFALKLNDIDDEPVGHNYGCVRCVPHIKPNNNNYDMFGWLASRHRRPEPNLNCTDLVPRRSSINNLPMAMRFRQLKSTSKYSVGVYRSKIHRRGLFCLRDFEAGEMVIEYSGEVIRSVLTDKREKYYNSKGIGCYMFRIDDNLVVDATMKGNAARFINHSCDPNCYSKVVEILGHKHIIIFALRRIICGEELTYDYKFPIEEDKIPCTCGTKKCRKFLN